MSSRHLQLATIRRVLKAHRTLTAAGQACIEAEDAFLRSQPRSEEASATMRAMNMADLTASRARSESHRACAALVSEVLAGYGLTLDSDPENLEALLEATSGLVRREREGSAA